MTLASEPDEALMLRYAAGDPAAFEVLYGRHELRVWRYLRRTVQDQATADELMQDVWFAVVRHAATYRPTARFTTWLLTLAHHRMVDWLRARRAHVSLDHASADGSSLRESLADERTPTPPQEAEAEASATALLAAIARLPDEQREAFLLQAEGEMSVADIALATGANIETAKSRLRYARAKLRELLWEYA